MVSHAHLTLLDPIVTTPSNAKVPCHRPRCCIGYLPEALFLGYSPAASLAEAASQKEFSMPLPHNLPRKTFQK